MSYYHVHDAKVLITDDVRKVPLIVQHQASIIISNGVIVKNRWGAL